MELKRLSGRKRCERVLRKGTMWKGKHFRLNWLPTAPDHPNIDRSVRHVYMGVSASLKLHKSAVKRNRMRRRVREAFRKNIKKCPLAPIQLIARPHSSSLECDFEEIVADVSAFFFSLSK